MYLVLHERDEGGDDKSDARGPLAVEVGWQLVAERLA